MPRRLVTDYESKSNAEKDWTIPWELIRAGKIEQGLAMMKQDFDQLPTPSEALRLGLGYLWAGKYQLASKHFDSAAHSKRTPGERLFAFAGVAEWCIGNREASIRFWQEGLRAPYATGGVCSQTPMLLFLASILKPGSFSKQDAKDLIAGTSKRVHAKFQAALGRFLLGELEEKGMEPYWIGFVEPHVRGEVPEYKWLTEFYENVLLLSRHEIDQDAFRGRMRSMTDTSKPEWSNIKTFTSILSCPEFFIARCEASKTS